MDTTRTALIELKEIIEDTVEYHCDKHRQSGQMAWNQVYWLSVYKLTDFDEAID